MNRLKRCKTGMVGRCCHPAMGAEWWLFYNFKTLCAFGKFSYSAQGITFGAAITRTWHLWGQPVFDLLPTVPYFSEACKHFAQGNILASCWPSRVSVSKLAWREEEPHYSANSTGVRNSCPSLAALWAGSIAQLPSSTWLGCPFRNSERVQERC